MQWVQKNWISGNATDEIQAKISGLKDQGIDFEVCSNTLRGKKIDFESDLYDVDKADIVPSGVAELARLQQMGYAYIKP
jgi:intracellular sulfur oxidation DsrE/DsrF family protein